MSQFIRNLRSWALDAVRKKSDFWIQRANPFDPSFSENEVYRKIEKSVSHLWPEHAGKVDGAIRSAILGAMQKEKEDRMRAMVWDPYGTDPLYDVDPANPYLTV